MKKTEIYLIFLYAVQLLVAFNFQAVLSKELLISGEFQKPQITSKDVNGWSQNIIRTCEQQNIVEYTGQIFGVFSQDVTKNYKTYSKLPPHWSALVRLDLLLYGSVDADEGDFAGISIDSYPMDRFTKNDKDGYKICSDSKSFFGQLFNDAIYPYQKNVTHTTNQLTIKIDSQFTGTNTPINYEGYGFKHVSVYIDTCYETCQICTGPSPSQCQSCIQNAEQVDGVCICSGSLFAYKFECVSVCPDGFIGNIKTKICEQSKCFNNCQNCINQSCTVCNIPYKLMNGECFLQCPPYTIDKKTYYGGYIFKGAFSSNFGESEIQGQGLKLINFKNGGATFSSCSGERYIGGWNVAGSGSEIRREIINFKPYWKMRIGFKYIMIDSWDNNEFIQVVINQNKIISNITHQQGTSVGNICGNKNPEVQGVYDYNFTDYSSRISISIRNNLNSNKSPFEASFGIREMYILVDFCQEGCLECNETGCTKCSNTKYLFQHNCLDNCPQDEGYWANQKTNTCDQCQDNCLTCDINTTSCIKCKKDTYFLNKKCLITCPDGYDSDKQTQECKKLDNPGIQCNDETYLFDNKCLSTCPDGYIPNQQTHKCDKSDNPGIQCKDETYLFDNKCSSTCPDGYIPNQQTHNCDKLDNPRIQCKDETYLFDNKCSSNCPDGYIPNQQTHQCDKSDNPGIQCQDGTYMFDNKCSSTCPDGYIPNQQTHQCDKLDNPGIQCKDGTYLFDNKCSSTCPDGYITNQQTHKCDKQDDTGIQCKGGTYFFDNKCQSSCPDGYTPNQQTHQCDKQDNPGIQCKDGTYLFDNKCSSTCPDGYITNEQTHKCDKQDDTGIECKDGTYFFDNKCQSTCPDGYTPNQQTHQCDKLDNPGTKCKDGTFLFDNKCQSTCPDKYAPNQATNECDNCHQSCKTCKYPKDENQCTSCSSNLFLSGTQCVEQCPNRTYQYTKTHKCEPCHSTCFSCIGKRNNQCQKCIRGYFFYKGECLKECPKSTYPKKI